ncbi:hypothetical protein [Streptomyces sp. NPDC001020]
MEAASSEHTVGVRPRKGQTPYGRRSVSLGGTAVVEQAQDVEPGSRRTDETGKTYEVDED